MDDNLSHEFVFLMFIIFRICLFTNFASPYSGSPEILDSWLLEGKMLSFPLTGNALKKERDK